MECLEARRLAEHGNAEARAHIDGCPVCRTVLAIVPTPPHPEAVNAHLVHLQSAIAREGGLLGRLRALPRWAVAAIAALQAGLACTWVALARPRPDLTTALHAQRWGWLALAGVILMIGVTWVARSSFRPQVPRVLAGWLLAWGVAATMLAQLLPPAEAVSVLDANFWLGSWRCFRFGVGLMVPLTAWLVLTRRGPGLSLQLRMALGAAFGLVALVALELHCPNPELSHRLLGHGAVVGLFSLGAGLRR